jgi:peptidoglycan/xylan/chitin deacetylase (PgdA/CDA1 family)
MFQPHPVTLTFDNGPEPGVTELVLDVLAARSILATFFVIGRKVATPSGRALVERARAAGHVVGNHTFSHSTPLGEAGDSVAAEILETQHLLGDLGPEKLFRPFGGGGALGPHLLSAIARDVLVAGGFTCVVWNAVPRDFADPDGWPETARRQIAGHRAAGVPSVLVLHDLPNGAMAHLPAFLDRLIADGARFTQEFPEDTVVIRHGQPTELCDRYVAGPVTRAVCG